MNERSRKAEPDSSSSSKTTLFFSTHRKKEFSRIPTNHIYLSSVNIKHPSLSTPDEEAALTPLCGGVIQGVGLQSDQDIKM